MAPRPSGPHLAQRLRNLALTSPTATSVFYARLYRALFPPTELDHDSLHVLALCYLSAGQAYPALHVVREYADADADPDLDIPDYENGIPARSPGCYGCAVIVAKCCNSLHRYTEGQAVLDRAIRRSVPMSRWPGCSDEALSSTDMQPFRRRVRRKRLLLQACCLRVSLTRAKRQPRRWITIPGR